MQFIAQDIATLLGGSLTGNGEHVVTSIAKIEEASATDIAFIANPLYEQYANTTQAGILLLNQTLVVENPHVGAIIRVADPYLAFTRLLEAYQQKIDTAQAKQGIEQPSYVGERSVYGAEFYLGAFGYIGRDVKIGMGVKIYPSAVIGDGVEIGDYTTIHAGAKVYQGCKIGSHCTIHAGVVIGGDGFGFVPQADGSYRKVPQTGIVTLGNDVEIGANTVIDRATIGATILHDGVKLDNLIHIAHNVEVGSNTVMAAQVGVSGSTKIGKQVMIGGQAGIVGHIIIADGVKINAQSGISKAITEPNRAVTGSPATDFREHYKGLAYLKRIPEILKRLMVLEGK